MNDVILLCGQWKASVTIPRPIAGDRVRFKGREFDIESVTLRAGSPIIECSIPERFAIDDYHMDRDGWEYLPNTSLHQRETRP